MRTRNSERYGWSGVVSGSVVPFVAAAVPRHMVPRSGPSTYWVEPPPETVKPNRLFTGTTHESSKPGRILNVGSFCGPDVRPHSIVLSRAAKYTLPLNTGLDRSNALRGTRLIEPARAEPGDSGVGE